MIKKFREVPKRSFTTEDKEGNEYEIVVVSREQDVTCWPHKSKQWKEVSKSLHWEGHLVTRIKKGIYEIVAFNNIPIKAKDLSNCV